MILLRLRRLHILPLILTLGIVAPACFAQDDLDSLRRQIAAQQQQIQELQRTLDTQQKLLERLEAERAKPATPAPAVSALKAPAEAPQSQASPLSWKIGTADFTPGGFMDMTSIFRSTNVGSGIGTSFAGIPFENTAAGRLTESRFSAQNSRLAMKITANAGETPVTGYVEADFLGALPANGHVSSNSDSFRMRLYWVNVRRGKWEVLGGQSWSMMTPNRTGISPVPSDLFYTQDVDTNYQVGLTWTRAPQFRVVYHAGSGLTAGFALENPQQFTGAGVTLPQFAAPQVDNNANPATPNLHPDLQAKLAWDGNAGKRAFHIEAAGLFRGFRIARPDLSTSTMHGFGGSLNGNLELVKNLRLFVTSYYSSGGGRYIFGQGPDLVIGANGDLSPIHSGSGIAGLEYQAAPASLLYAYYSTAYFGRNFSPDADGKYLGYGFPGSPASNNRTLQEWTFGYNHTFWKNPHYGALQLLNQYSYVTRAPWSAPATGPRDAHTHMLYNNLRFVLP